MKNYVRFADSFYNYKKKDLHKSRVKNTRIIKYFMLGTSFLFLTSCFEREFSPNQKVWYYVFRKDIDAGSAGSGEVNSECKLIDLKSDEHIFKSDALDSHRQQIKDKAGYIIASEQKSDYLYSIRDNALKNGENYVSAEGILFSNYEEDCQKLNSKVKILVENYSIKRNEILKHRM
ncbi:MAG: hypothetical protein H7235_08840 [Bdellovibrionaceae bacterium]|nr:hypothetical protein [Pseudobdellovibrionaceae bacterium]